MMAPGLQSGNDVSQFVDKSGNGGPQFAERQWWAPVCRQERQ
jgi:hypothetical protein